jgi:signal transduction histidine kinase
MRLAHFIGAHLEAILAAWESFARSNGAAAPTTDSAALRHHAAHMLAAIASDLGTAQTREQGGQTSMARGPQAVLDSAAATYGAARLISGFSIEQLLAEYRALRSCVLRLWSEHGRHGLPSDIDDILRFNDALDQALAESVARYSAMIRHAQHLFLAILGHDLRNPLNTTVVASSLLMRMPDLAPNHAQVVARIQRSGLRMARLVDDLVDYTRTHLGSTLPMTLARANMATICRATVDELRLAHPGRAIRVEAQANLDGTWDEGRMAQVFSNLLGNALQHGAQHAPVSVRIVSGARDIVAHIHNEGKPIAPRAMAMMFDPLVRFADPRAQRPGADNSLGIGLYIARAIVEAHGGRIEVSSQAGHGTTFSVHIPRAPPGAASIQVVGAPRQLAE